MNTQKILSILRGERETNPNMGIEEDDLLANGFFDLSSGEHDAFWLAFSAAMKALVADNEGLPVYLASRFIFRMSEIKPSRIPRKKILFDFLLTPPDDDVHPARLAGTLLALLVLKKGKAEFWKLQIAASLNSLETTQGDHYAMAAVVYAFLGYNRHVSIPAEDWEHLFATLSRLSRLPRMELLELLVGVEKDETQHPRALEEEISVGLDAWKTSASDNHPSALAEHLPSVLRAWLNRNAPDAAVAAWLRRELRPRAIQAASPRARAVELMACAHREVA
jgi:hypothetical protein